MFKNYRRLKDIKGAGFVREEKLTKDTYKGTLTFSDETDGSAEVVVKYYPKGGASVIRPATWTDDNMKSYRLLMKIYETMEESPAYRKKLRERFIVHNMCRLTIIIALALSLRSIIHAEGQTEMAVGIIEAVIATIAANMKGYILKA